MKINLLGKLYKQWLQFIKYKIIPRIQLYKIQNEPVCKRLFQFPSLLMCKNKLLKVQKQHNYCSLKNVIYRQIFKLLNRNQLDVAWRATFATSLRLIETSLLSHVLHILWHMNIGARFGTKFLFTKVAKDITIMITYLLRFRVIVGSRTKGILPTVISSSSFSFFVHIERVFFILFVLLKCVLTYITDSE